MIVMGYDKRSVKTAFGSMLISFGAAFLGASLPIIINTPGNDLLKTQNYAIYMIGILVMVVGFFVSLQPYNKKK